MKIDDYWHKEPESFWDTSQTPNRTGYFLRNNIAGNIFEIAWDSKNYYGVVYDLRKDGIYETAPFPTKADAIKWFKHIVRQVEVLPVAIYQWEENTGGVGWINNTGFRLSSMFLLKRYYVYKTHNKTHWEARNNKLSGPFYSVLIITQPYIVGDTVLKKFPSKQKAIDFMKKYIEEKEKTQLQKWKILSYLW